MSKDEVLSQDEVDALTKSDQTSTPLVNGEGGVFTIDFAHQERIVRSEYPVLVRIHERMGRRLAENIYQMFGRESEVTTGDIQVKSFGEFVLSFTMPTSFNVYRFHPLRGKALLIFDSDSVSTLVDSYFGGDGSYQSKIADREFTTTEQRVVQVVIKRLFAELENAWTPIQKVKCEWIGSEMNPQLVTAIPATDLIIVSSFDMTFDEQTSKFYIVMPYSMLEPIREDLDVGSTRTDDEIDPNWVKSLRDEILDAPLTINSILVERDLTLRDILNMRAGDVIPVELPETVMMNIEGVPSFRANFDDFQ